VLLGLVQAWIHRFAMNPDGVSYLDIGDRFWSGHWSALGNGYWSPLYAFLVGLVLKVLRPTSYWEFPAVHLLNVLIYLVGLGCFECFLREFIKTRNRADDRAIPEHLWLTIGYLLFISASLFSINLKVVSPDMCVAACVYLAAAFLLRIRADPTRRVNFILLGAALGAGYLSKSVMFPVSLLMLALTFIMARSWRRQNRSSLLAPLVFFALASPLVLALSISKGRPTFGDSGKLNYAWEVSGIPKYVHWQGGPPGSGQPKHPTRKVLDYPTAYEFATPVPGSYPPWYDPSYWFDGLKTKVSLARQVDVFMGWLTFCSSNFVDLCGGLFSVLFLLVLMNRRRWSLRKMAASWWLALIAIVPMLMYSLVFVAARYLAAFEVILWLCLFSGVQAGRPESRRWFDKFSVCLALLLIVSFRISTATIEAARNILQVDPQPVQWQIANGLNQMGVRPGEKVAAVGDALYAHWYRLAHVQVIGEVTSGTNGSIAFWHSDAGVRAQILDAFAVAGARAVVVWPAPRDQSMEGWRRIDETDAYVYFLNGR
jgi:hypothetical protein